MHPVQLTRWRVVLRLRSPMQVGAGTLGMIERTEMFVPPRVAWGAIAAALAQRVSIRKNISSKAEVSSLFLSIGAALQPPRPDGHRTFDRFSPLLPSFDDGKSLFIPVFEGNTRRWSRTAPDGAPWDSEKPSLTESAFRAIVMSGVASNAIDPERMATSDQTLHETDMLSPVVKTDAGIHPLSIVGRMDLPESIDAAGEHLTLDKPLLQEIFAALRFGGGRKRGWGRVTPHAIEKAPGDSSPLSHVLSDGYSIVLNSDAWPVAPSHKGGVGRAVLAVHREYCQANGHGRAFSPPRICWELGTRIPAQAAGAEHQNANS